MGMTKTAELHARLDDFRAVIDTLEGFVEPEELARLRGEADELDPRVDTRTLEPEKLSRLGAIVEMLRPQISTCERAIGTARVGALEPIRNLIESFESSGWVPRSVPGTWPAEFDGPATAAGQLSREALRDIAKLLKNLAGLRHRRVGDADAARCLVPVVERAAASDPGGPAGFVVEDVDGLVIICNAVIARSRMDPWEARETDIAHAILAAIAKHRAAKGGKDAAGQAESELDPDHEVKDPEPLLEILAELRGIRKDLAARPGLPPAGALGAVVGEMAR